MNQFDQQWRKLTTLARQAGGEAETAAPYGFAGRVAARAVAMSSVNRWPLEYFAMRGLLVAVSFGVAAVAFSYTPLSTSTQTDAYSAVDTVGEILDLS